MINEMQFKGFRFTVGDEVVLKSNKEKAVIVNAKFEITTNEANVFKMKQTYNVRVGTQYGYKSVEEKDIMLPDEMEPEAEIKVLQAILDVYLSNRQYELVKETHDRIEFLKGGKEDATQV